MKQIITWLPEIGDTIYYEVPVQKTSAYDCPQCLGKGILLNIDLIAWECPMCKGKAQYTNTTLTGEYEIQSLTIDEEMMKKIKFHYFRTKNGKVYTSFTHPISSQKYEWSTDPNFPPREKNIGFMGITGIQHDYSKLRLNIKAKIEDQNLILIQ